MLATDREPREAEFSDLYQRFHAPILRYIARRLGGYSSEAEDVAADVFVSALRAYRGSACETQFRPWVYEVARNACIDHHRRAHRRPAPLMLDEAMTLLTSDARGGWDSRGGLAALRSALADLPSLDRQLIAQRELGGLSYAQLAERTGLSGSAVETALFRARRNLLARFRLLSGERASGSGCRFASQRAA
ncbi:MAG: RNA polymerase sigma factor [Solirubrobacteraceae bacterium]